MMIYQIPVALQKSQIDFLSYVVFIFWGNHIKQQTYKNYLGAITTNYSFFVIKRQNLILMCRKNIILICIAKILVAKPINVQQKDMP